MGVKTRELRACRVAAQSQRNRNSAPNTHQAGEEQKGHKKRLQKYLQSETMTKGSLALWDRDSK